MEDDIFKRTKATQFIKLIEAFSANYADRPISELLADILDKSGYEEALRTEGSQERLDNIAELKQSVYDYERTCGEESMLEHYLTHIALYTNTDTEVKGDKVKLMTVHAAKGLEFPYVFLCSMSEGIFPSKKTNTMEKMEEERRLAFVAMTRAEKRLYLSEAEGRNLDGSPRFPSRFVLDIDDSLLEHTNKPDDCLIRDAKDYIEWTVKYMPENLDNIILPAGQRVRHAVFGEGTVIDVDNNKGAHIIKFDAMDTPRTISFKVKIEKL